MTLTKIDDRGFKYPINLLDNEKIRLGTDNDFEIYHNSPNSVMSHNPTGAAGGAMFIQSNNMIIRSKSETNILTSVYGQATEIYHIGGKRFQTTLDGINVVNTGGSGATKLRVTANEAQNAELHLVADEGDDNIDNWKISSNGSSNTLNFENWNGAAWEKGLSLTPNSSTSLYYDNSEKFETTSGGARILGNLQLDADNRKAIFGSSNDLEIFHNGTDSIIRNTGHPFRVRSNDFKIENEATEDFIECNNNAEVILYYDNVAKFKTTSAGVNIPDNAKLGLGSHPSAGGDLLIWHNGSDNFIDTRWNLTIRKDDGAETLAKFNNNAAVELYYDNVKKFETTTNGAKITGGLTTSGYGNTAANNTFGADMSHGARNINIFASSTSANPYYSFVGTNLKLDSTNLVKNSDAAGSNWGNVAGIVFEGANQNANSGKNPAIRFLLDQPAGNGLNYSLGSHEGDGNQVSAITSRTAAYFDTNGHFYHPDNKKAIYGTGEDLQIYHDGSNSRITDSGSGGLLINSSGFDVLNAADNEYMARFIQNAGVELYNNNVKKFATGSNGVYHDNSGTLADNAIHFERGTGTGDFSTIFGVTNNPDCSGYGDQDDGYWNLLKSKGGTHIVLNSDGAYNSGRNNHDHFSIYQKANTEVSNAGRRLFSVDNIGQVQFGKAGIVINNAWGNQPSITVQRDNNHGEDNTDNSAYMRVHGIGDTHKYWTGAESAGADFSVNFIIDGSTYATSDGRAKTDIVDCPYGLDVVNKLQPRKYQLVNSQLTPQGNDNINLGFVAQEIKEHIPECVNYLGDEANTPNEKGWARAYALDIGEVIPVLTKAIQELSDKVKTLETKVATLEAA